MSTNSEILTNAIQYHHNGQLETAEQLYQQILQADPNHAVALCHLGLIASQRGKHETAIELMSRGVQLKGDVPEFHVNLAGANLALRRIPEAIDCCRRAIELKPDFPSAHNNLGLALKDQGKLLEAVTCFRRALELNPRYTDANLNLGIALIDQGKMDEASVCCRKAFELKPANAQAWNHLGKAFGELGLFDESVICCRSAIELQPDYFDAHNNLGVAFGKQRKLQEATACFRKALEINAEHAGAQNNLGVALGEQGKLDEAMACYQKALSLQSNYAGAHSNLGYVLREKGQNAEAIACFQRAVEFKPDYADAHKNLGMSLLLAGNLELGWREYEWRIKALSYTAYDRPLWDGSPLAGRRILLFCEQGLGDTIQFMRYGQFVKERGGYVISACPAPLMKLLKNIAGIDELILLPDGTQPKLPAFDAYSYLMSIPALLGTTLESIPNSVPYLHADERLIERWHHELSNSEELRIGIAWQGSRSMPVDRGRSIPLVEFEPLGKLQGVQLFSLQKGDGSEQVQSLAGRLPVIDFTHQMDESTGPFLDTAALMMNLDLVITSDTSIAHLAGALGVPVWLALKQSSDWRWMMDRDDSPWYPTMRLFRQETPGDWKGVFQRITAEVERFRSRTRTIPDQ